MADPILVIGAGLSGLAAALDIEAAGESCVIVDQAHHLGGKLETTIVEDAYRLDRGFQVLLPSYPELKRFETLTSDLELQFFNSGARLEMKAGSILMANPLVHPQHLLATALGPYASFHDKLLVLKLQQELQSAEPSTLLTSAEGSTLDYLRSYGFSERMIAVFWKPFFSGIFLENELKTAAGFFRYLTRMFAASPVAVPKKGIGELPKYLASKLKRSEIRLGTRAERTGDRTVRLNESEQIQTRCVITETQGHTTPENAGPFGCVTSFWFKSPEAPFEGAWLSLNSKGTPDRRLINHVAVLSNVSSDYAMKGDALTCVSVVGLKTELNPTDVLVEAEGLYGSTVKTWSLLRTDRIERALPLYLNRTDTDTPSQQGALFRGRQAAQLALKNHL